MKNKSFTLIELLVVIVIIGILAGVIMISTSSSIDKANIAKSKVFEESIENNLAANMVSRWKLDEIIGAAAPYTTPDQWGSNTGTLYGANGLPQLRPVSECVTGGCFKFDGVDDYINLGTNNVLKPIDQISVAAWVNVSKGSIIERQNNYLVAYRLFIHSDNGRPVMQIGYTNVSPYAKTATAFTDVRNKWHYIVGTYDHKNVRIYVDGLQENIESNTDDIFYSGSHSATISYHAAEADHFAKGLIDDARIYNAALSSSQIKQNYIAGLNSMLANGNISKKEYNKRINALAYDN
jgi:prepilin-type N-terminal cleavage/methylation domain-containing protein